VSASWRPTTSGPASISAPASAREMEMGDQSRLFQDLPLCRLYCAISPFKVIDRPPLFILRRLPYSRASAFLWSSRWLGSPS
jgi:hypothetical protein